MAYCTGKSKAIVEYSFGDKKAKKFETELVPIDVQTNEPGNSGVCWRFTGQGVNNSANYEYFACGTSPSYAFNGSGCNLYMDGIMLGGNGYEYKSGTNTVNRVDSMSATSGYITSGNCNCLAECEIKILKDGQIIFSDKGTCPLKFHVTCDDDCPEGSHKCTHNKYPGYCCVPCKEVGDKLKNIATIVGR
jgi:hypothetical protein